MPPIAMPEEIGARAQSRDKTVRSTYDPATGWNIRIKPGCLPGHSPASLATALRETIAEAFQASHASSAGPKSHDSQFGELLASIKALHAAATGPHDAVKVGWRNHTPEVSVRAVVLRWTEAAVADEATAAANKAFQVYGEQIAALVQSTLRA